MQPWWTRSIAHGVWFCDVHIVRIRVPIYIREPHTNTHSIVLISIPHSIQILQYCSFRVIVPNLLQNGYLIFVPILFVVTFNTYNQNYEVPLAFIHMNPFICKSVGTEPNRMGHLSLTVTRSCHASLASPVFACQTFVLLGDYVMSVIYSITPGSALILFLFISWSFISRFAFLPQLIAPVQIFWSVFGAFSPNLKISVTLSIWYCA